MLPFGTPTRSPFSEIQLKSLMKDDLYWNGGLSGSRPYRNMVDRAFATAFPGPRRFDATGRAIAAKAAVADPSGFDIGRVSLTAPVGAGGANRGRDVGRAGRIFETLGLLDGRSPDGGLPGGQKAGQAPRASPRLTSAIRGFQNMFGLKPDGLMNPGGPTARMLEATFGGETPSASASAKPGRPGLLKPAPEEAKKKEQPQIRDLLWRRKEDGGKDRRMPMVSRPGEVWEDGRWRPMTGAEKVDAKRKENMPLIESAASSAGGADSSRGGGDGKDGKRGGQEALPAEARKTKERFQAWAAWGRKAGLKDAADNLERYLSGKGGIKTYTPQQSRALGPIRDAGRMNRNRFENGTFLGNSKSSSIPKLRNIKDGEAVNFEDKWDRDFTDQDSIKQGLTGNLDFVLSQGRIKLESKGDFTAIRRGDTVYIEGKVGHGWKDTYDFHKGRSAGDAALRLQRHGEAKPFEIRGGWTQRVKGTVTIRDGKLSNPKFRWEDRD